MNYEFTIPSGSLGLTSDRAIKADRGLSRQVSFSLLTAKFGDGYEQRGLNGINNKQEQLSVSFNNREYREGNLIAAFFDSKAALNFDLKITNNRDVEASTPTEAYETIRVACDGYNLVYVNDTTISIQAQFRRVYEPTA